MSIEHYIKKEVIKQQPLLLKESSPPFPTYQKSFKKNDIITHFGQIENNAYFLIDGVIESSIAKDGEIRITDFVFSNHFIGHFLVSI